MKFEEGVRCVAEVLQIIASIQEDLPEEFDNNNFFCEGLILFNTLKGTKEKANVFLKSQHKISEKDVQLIMGNLFTSLSFAQQAQSLNKNFSDTVKYYRGLGQKVFINYDELIQDLLNEVFLSILKITEYEEPSLYIKRYVTRHFTEIIKKAATVEVAHEQISSKLREIVKNETSSLSLSFQDELEETLEENIRYLKKTISFIRSDM